MAVGREVEGEAERFMACSLLPRFLWELCWLWEERLLLLHRILQPHQPEAEHTAQETEASQVLSGPERTGGTDQRTVDLLERLR